MKCSRTTSKFNWLPEHIRDGRFGNFLESNVDWALSRERYLGHAVADLALRGDGRCRGGGQLCRALAKAGSRRHGSLGGREKSQPRADRPSQSPQAVHRRDHLRFHAARRSAWHAHAARARSDRLLVRLGRHAVRAVGLSAPKSGEILASSFPADFISEAIDQTRGWFYSQLAISTLLFRDHGPEANTTDWPAKSLPLPFRNCIVLGLMLGEDGNKMSKSKRNYREPSEIFDRYGADALRWYFFANQPPWTTIRYSERAIKESIPEFLLRLWNVYSFFVIYATIDGFEPSAALLSGDAGELESGILSRSKDYRPIAERGELDRWVLSELHRTAAAVTSRMDDYDNFAACQRITEFVDALSNWYVRRSRDRFWSEDKQSREKRDAYWTLYECLITTAKMVAPFVPFLAEALWQNLAVAPFRSRVTESVHLTDFPTGDAAVMDELLSARMSLVREIASQGRAARMGAS